MGKLLAITYLTISTNVMAEWVTGTGQYTIHSDISERDACRNAENQAKEDAIKKITGEDLSTSNYQLCNDENIDTDPSEGSCRLISTLISVTQGFIISTRNKKEQIIGENDLRYCYYSMEANVVKRNNPDPSFDFDVSLNSLFFQDGDEMEIEINPGSPMYVSLFVFSIESGADQLVSRLYPGLLPNGHVEETQKISKTTIFPRGKNMLYDVSFPADTMKSKISEVLYIVATKNRVNFNLTRFSIDEFNTKISEIPSNEIRLKHIPFHIIKQKIKD